MNWKMYARTDQIYSRQTQVFGPCGQNRTFQKNDNQNAGMFVVRYETQKILHWGGELRFYDGIRYSLNLV